MLFQWSTTPANNATAATNINWQEGQAPSTVNDSARQMMADVAADLMADREWLKFGDTPTYISGTQFSVPGNKTTTYTNGRRVRATINSRLLYGTITASSYSSVTSVTVVWDGGSLDNTVSEVDLGILNPVSSSIGNIIAAGGNVTSGTASLSNEVNYYMVNSNTNSWLFLLPTGVMGFDDGTRGLVRWQSDTAGNFTVAGTLTQNSDERLKEDWESLPADFIERLAQVKSGTYTRIDTKARYVGVGAQSLQSLLPEAVLESEQGVLSVAYAQAALVACVELAKEVMRLRSLVEKKN